MMEETLKNGTKRNSIGVVTRRVLLVILSTARRLGVFLRFFFVVGGGDRGVLARYIIGGLWILGRGVARWFGFFPNWIPEK